MSSSRAKGLRIFVYYSIILFELLVFCRAERSGNVTRNDKMVQICKHAALVYFKVIPHLLSENTEKKKGNYQI